MRGPACRRRCCDYCVVASIPGTRGSACTPRGFPARALEETPARPPWIYVKSGVCLLSGAVEEGKRWDEGEGRGGLLSEIHTATLVPCPHRVKRGAGARYTSAPQLAQRSHGDFLHAIRRKEPTDASHSRRPYSKKLDRLQAGLRKGWCISTTQFLSFFFFPILFPTFFERLNTFLLRIFSATQKIPTQRYRRNPYLNSLLSHF